MIRSPWHPNQEVEVEPLADGTCKATWHAKADTPGLQLALHGHWMAIGSYVLTAITAEVTEEPEDGPDNT